MSDNLQSSVLDAKISPGLCTDHSAIGFHLKWNSTVLGPGLWKLNTQHLKDSDFVRKVNEAITEVADSDPTTFSNKRNQWDFLKYKVKVVCIRESKIRAKTKKI